MSAFLDGCPVVDVPGRPHPLEIDYAPRRSRRPRRVERASRDTDGSVLCFLPGAAEIRRAQREVAHAPRREAPTSCRCTDRCRRDEQDAALAGTGTAGRVILATNIAETSLTVPGVRAVVDTGLHKVARYDADRAIDSLETERIPQDAADQRAGPRRPHLAAGRVGGCGSARSAAAARPAGDSPHRSRGGVLAVIAWGGDPRKLEWFEPPARYSSNTYC